MPTFQGTKQQKGIPLIPKSMPIVRDFNNPGMAGMVLPFQYKISGTTKDSGGSNLGNCNLVLFRTENNSVAALGASDASGIYSFDASPALTHYIVAYKPGATDVEGTTVNTLTGS